MVNFSTKTHLLPPTLEWIYLEMLVRIRVLSKNAKEKEVRCFFNLEDLDIKNGRSDSQSTDEDDTYNAIIVKT